MNKTIEVMKKKVEVATEAATRSAEWAKSVAERGTERAKSADKLATEWTKLAEATKWVESAAQSIERATGAVAEWAVELNKLKGGTQT